MADNNPLKALLDGLANGSGKQEEKVKKPHRFWNTQPVPKDGESFEGEGAIEIKTNDEIRKDPYPIQADFEWYLVDINNENDLKDTYQLLTANYVEDDDATFRFDYSAEFLKWALQPPGWQRDWHIAIRVVKTKKLVAFISGIPAHIRVNDSVVKVVEINFLCIHKKLRSKRLAPTLIKEVTRRVNLHGIFQAVYTAGIKLQKPITTARYFHRTLNPKKLVDIGFTSIPRDFTMQKMIKKYKLPTVPALPGIQEMTTSDVPQVTKLLNEYLLKFKLAPSMTEDEVRHWQLPIDKVIYSYVVKEGEKVTDFVSFYSLPSSVSGNNEYSHLQAAYLFYYTPKGLGNDKERTKALIYDALILAKQVVYILTKAKFDVFNCLALAENEEFVSELSFGPGNGYLNYYMYNYRCQDLEPSNLSVVML